MYLPVKPFQARRDQGTPMEDFDSFEMTKIAGAVLSALLVIVGARTFIELSSEGHVEKPGYTLPKPAEGGAAGASAAGGKSDDGGDAVPLLAAASADNGKSVFNKCKSCHSVDAGKNGVGPSLHGVVNRAKGTEAGYKYSDAMKGKGGNWSFEDLSHFIMSPKAFVPGTKMGFAGIASAHDRADLIAYLATVGDTPVPLPKAPAAAPADAPKPAEKPAK